MISHTHNFAHLLLSVTFVIVSISLYEPVLSWIQILVFCAFVMRVSNFLGLQKHQPSLRTLNLLALLAGIVLAYFSWQLGILLGMVNLLVMACALKLMLLRNNKDFYQLIVSMMFLISCGFIFHQSIIISLLYILLVLMLLASLGFQLSPNLNYKSQLRNILVMSAQAIPIGFLLFVVMPKLTPFWQMPTSQSAETGLTDSITPGDIANLSQSSDLAFRVTFENDVPNMQQRYWRAIVLEDFDGRTWQIARQRKRLRQQSVFTNTKFSPQVSGPNYTYEVMVGATNQSWLFGLDLAVPADALSASEIWQSLDYQLVSKKPLFSSFQYKVTSYPQAKLNQTRARFDKNLNLKVPESGNPKTKSWVKEMRQSVDSDEAFVNLVLNHFRTQGYTYTLQPSVMPNDAIDKLLFEQKAGFCAHYASAMAYMLRLADIPARIVAGYQGGEMREDHYLSVYQYDAHAWVEAWYDETGWQRLDPTAEVSPDRISQGLQVAIAEEGSFLLESPFSLAKLKSIPFLNELRLMLADFDYFWSRWVLGFNAQSQQDLFKTLLGKLSPERLGFLGLAVLTIISLLLAMFYLPNWRREKINPALKLYRTAQQLLANLNIHRPLWQGPLEFAREVENRCDNAPAQAFNRLSKLYVSLQFRKPAENKQQVKKQLLLMRTELKKLKAGLKSM